MKKREIIDIYVKSIVKEWSTGVAKEHSYRPALQYFANISEDVWDYVVGSCQPLKKWLTDRIGRKLNYDDEEYYKDMVKAISKTLKIEKSIDGCMI